MKVRVRHEGIVEETGKDVVFAISGKKVKINRDFFKHGKFNSIILERAIADKNRLKWKLLFHIPPKIKPIYNQTSIYELRVKATNGY